MEFSAIRGVIIDMDGVLWRGDVSLPGLVPFFEMLRARSIPFVLATNNSSRAPESYAQKLANMGVPDVLPEQIITSGTAAASYLGMHYPPGTRVHVLGGDGLRQVMTEAGFTLADDDAGVVVVGLDPALTYDKLKRAAFLIRGGASFIATNDDATFPTPEGLAPGAGSLVAALVTATDRQPDAIMGKPHAPMYEAALRLLETPPTTTLMIGDRLNTDIEGAQRIRLRTAIVLTGVSTRAEVDASPVKPDGIYADLGALLAAWAG
jgi:4-nitrophenyl phosphatase